MSFRSSSTPVVWQAASPAPWTTSALPWFAVVLLVIAPGQWGDRYVDEQDCGTLSNSWGRVMKMMILVALLAITISGCATIITGTEQQVGVDTDPPAAKISFSNGQTCMSPCTITAKRYEALQVTI